MTSSPASADFDVVVVGAGFAGLYAVHRLRDQKGLRVRGFDGGADVGGTWYWNQYPGARCDIESIYYSYSFSEELQQDWIWSERYAAQPEILAYLNHAADRFDLRRNFQFNTRVTSLAWDDESSIWRVHADDGSVVTARFIVWGVGVVSHPKKPDFPGLEDFEGEVYSTNRWPHEGVDLAGKRVGIIGTGASGVQAIQTIAEEVGHLTVFQRTANYCAPNWNRLTDPEEYRKMQARYPEIRAFSRDCNLLGIEADHPEPSAKLATDEERRKRLDYYYGETRGGLHLLLSSYADVLFDEESNEYVAEYIRERIAERVTDPEVAELLTPRDHPYGTRRPPMEDGYYEAFNRDNVTLVDVKNDPIQAITPRGLRTEKSEYEFDVLILAIGFDSFTGPLLSIGVTGRNGLTMKEKWADGPKTFLGIATHGFPNLFIISGPQSAIGLYNNPLSIEDHVDMASDAIEHLFDNGKDTIEATAEAESDWVDHVTELGESSLIVHTNSWWVGSNIPGKPRGLMTYIGGAPAYRAICAEVVDEGYKGFTIAAASVPQLSGRQ
jgi:cyclohexanone monooxygenase